MTNPRLHPAKLLVALTSLFCALGSLHATLTLAALLQLPLHTPTLLLAAFLAALLLGTRLLPPSSSTLLPLIALLLLLALPFALLFSPTLQKALCHTMPETVILLGLLLSGCLRLLSQQVVARWHQRPNTTPLFTKSSVGLLLIAILLSFGIKPYFGPLGQSVVFGLCGIPPALFATTRNLTSHNKSLLITNITMLALITTLSLTMLPWPQTFVSHQVLYTTRIDAEPVTVHAHKVQNNVFYAVTTRSAVTYQSTNAYRYAELMVHPAFALSPTKPKRILLIGGENGSILREIAKYHTRASIVRLDLYPRWTQFFQQSPVFRRINAPSLFPPHRQHIVLPPSLNGPTLSYILRNQTKPFDLILGDLPRPHASNMHFFYPEIFRELLQLLSPQGMLALHLGSPYTQGPLYWCLISQWTRHKVHVIPYQLAPALYQDYGFALISKQPPKPFQKPLHIPVHTRFLPTHTPFHIFARFSQETTPDGAHMTPSCFRQHHKHLQ